MNIQQQENPKRQERAQRILDAAAALILRWGYNKTTIDDIARQAGVAKGTIYLHWKTREDLFAALVKREKLYIAEELSRRIAEDPVGATLRGIVKHSTLALMKHPLMKALLLRDMDVLGKLAQSENNSDAHIERMEGFKIYLTLLREHGLVRTDLSMQAQLYLYSAIVLGFFTVAPWLPGEYAFPDEEMAELMAETVHRVLEPDHAVSAEKLQIVSQAFMLYLQHAAEVAQKQFQQELEQNPSGERKNRNE